MALMFLQRLTCTATLTACQRCYQCVDSGCYEALISGYEQNQTMRSSDGYDVPAACRCTARVLFQQHASCVATSHGCAEAARKINMPCKAFSLLFLPQHRSPRQPAGPQHHLLTGPQRLAGSQDDPPAGSQDHLHAEHWIICLQVWRVAHPPVRGHH